MEATYYFCTINQYLPKLQNKLYQSNFSLSEFLYFLRCIPLNYSIDSESYKHDGQKYYLLLDDQGPIFRIYLSKPTIEIVMLNQPKVPIHVQTANLKYSQVSHLYKKISLVNFDVNVYCFNLQLNFYMLGNHPSTGGYRISSASFELIKLLNRMYPNSKEIMTEKLLCIDAYSHQQQINIYKSIAKEIKLIDILIQKKGISRIFVHDQKDGEIKYNATSTINGFCWIAPWTYEALMKFSYIELDCTFAILNPYVTCIPQLITKNVSLPLGFIAGVEEDSELYRLLYTELQHILGKEDRLHELPVLSDQGPGLIKFCHDNNLVQFFCLRHVINLVGPKSFFGKLIRKLLMSQTEPEFVNNHQYTIKALNGYYLVNKNIPSKVLKYSFTAISKDEIIADPNVDDELLFKTLLFNRGYVAAASNHAEGFHRQLKSIANLNLGIEHNIEKLIDQICKRYEKYQSGESGKKLCDRIKNDLLEMQAKYKIEPVEECSCGTTFHKELMLECEIPCIHTITHDSQIVIPLPKLDEKRFLNDVDFKPIKSPLTGSLKLTNKDIDIDDSEEFITLEEISKAIQRNREFLQFYQESLLNEELEEIIRDSTVEALKLGLCEKNIDDFIKFNMMDYLLNGSDIEQFHNNKEINLGRYFAIYQK